jgi:hypothetical protein
MRNKWLRLLVYDDKFRGHVCWFLYRERSDDDHKEKQDDDRSYKITY